VVVQSNHSYRTMWTSEMTTDNPFKDSFMLSLSNISFQTHPHPLGKSYLFHFLWIDMFIYISVYSFADFVISLSLLLFWFSRKIIFILVILDGYVLHIFRSSFFRGICVTHTLTSYENINIERNKVKKNPNFLHSNLLSKQKMGI
jgi:hypothetical protein